MTEGTVYITKDGRPAAAVLSIERYHELLGDDDPDLDDLTREFDAMLDRMQTAQAAAGFDALFEMEPEELGQAAVRSARTEAD
jgi:hypothetical protein